MITNGIGNLTFQYSKSQLQVPAVLTPRRKKNSSSEFDSYLKPSCVVVYLTSDIHVLQMKYIGVMDRWKSHLEIGQMA